MVDDHEIKNTWQTISTAFKDAIRRIIEKLEKELLSSRKSFRQRASDMFSSLKHGYKRHKNETNPDVLIAAIRDDGATKEVYDIPDMTLEDCTDLSNRMRDVGINKFAISVRVTDKNSQLMQMLNFSERDKNKLINLQKAVSEAVVPEVQDQKQAELIKWVCKKVKEKGKDNPNILKHIKCTITANKRHMNQIEGLLQSDPVLSQYSVQDRARVEAKERIQQESKKCVEKICCLDTMSMPTFQEFTQMEGNFGNIASLNSPTFKNGYYCMKMDEKSFARLRFKDEAFANAIVKDGDKFPIVATHRTDEVSKGEVHIYIPVMTDKEGNRDNSNLESLIYHVDKLGMNLENDCDIQEFSMFNQGLYDAKNENKTYTITCMQNEKGTLVPMKEQEDRLGIIANVLHNAGYKTSMKVLFENYGEGETVPTMEMVTDCPKQKIDELIKDEVKKKVAESKAQGLEASENIRLLQRNILINKRSADRLKSDKILIDEFKENGVENMFTHFATLLAGTMGGSKNGEMDR